MKLITHLTHLASRNAPVILTSLSVAGTLATAIMAGQATLEAKRTFDVRIRIMDEHVTKMDVVRATWTHYIPAAIMGASTIACIIGAHNVHTRRAAALASMYSIADAALREYKDKVIETIGHNKERKIRDEIAHDHVNSNPASLSGVILNDDTKVLCYDTMSGRYWSCDMETLRKAQNDVNAQLIHEMYCSLNEFYSKVGLDSTKLGEEVGWDTNRFLELEFSTQLSDDNRPCIVVDYRLSPRSGYGELR